MERKKNINQTEGMEMKKGDRVTVTGTTMGGEKVVEGIAVLINKEHGDEYNPIWKVRFEEDAPDETYNRFESQMKMEE